MARSPDALVDFRAEVAQYDQLARVGRWNGPRHQVTHRELGEGPPLVLLPGLASTYRGYAPTLIRLSRRYRTFQLEYPGENPLDGATLGSIRHDHLVDDLLGWLDHQNLDRASLFGLSFGSTVTLEALRRAPDRFPRGVVQGGFARRRLRAAERWALALGRLRSGTASRLLFHRRGLAINNRATFPDNSPDLWSFYVEENGRTPIAGLAHRLDLLQSLDLRPFLAQIHQPVGVIAGDRDRIVPHECYQELLAGLANAQGFLLPEVGHQPHWTHPDKLAKVVGDFLSQGEETPG